MRCLVALAEATARAFETRWGAERAAAARVPEAMAQVLARADDMAGFVREMERVAREAGIPWVWPATSVTMSDA